MVDTSALFFDFNSSITLTTAKGNALRTSRNALRSDIKKWFNEKGKKQPSFCWQGSFSMKTLINPIDGKEYDLDDGIYLQGYENVEMDSWPSPTTVHSWIKDAVKDRVKKDPIDKDTCIRVPYASGYHIDFPIYIMKDDVAYLAHKGKGWIESDPKAFRQWFIDKVGDDDYGEQLRSIVKYLKAWCDYKSISLKGIEITILATNSFDRYDGRDDKSIRNTVENIISILEKNFNCKKPVTPYEDLFESASQLKKDNVLKGLNMLKFNLDKAIDEVDEKKASEYLRNSFGSRFPLGKETKKEELFAVTAAPGVLKHDGRSA